MDLLSLKALIAQKLEHARHSSLIHLTLTSALNALEQGASDEGERLIAEAEKLGGELRDKLSLPPVSKAAAPTGETVTTASFETFKRSLDTHVADWIDELTRRAEATVGGLLTSHVALLEKRFPNVVPALHEAGAAMVAQQTLTPELELEPQTLPENEAPAPAGPTWPPPLDGEFPTPAAFAALGFYPETYAHQLAEWEARKAAASAPVEPTTPAEETPATGTTAENGPSESATGASPETR